MHIRYGNGAAMMQQWYGASYPMNFGHSINQGGENLRLHFLYAACHNDRDTEKGLCLFEVVVVVVVFPLRGQVVLLLTIYSTIYYVRFL